LTGTADFSELSFRVEDIALTAVAAIQPAAYLESGDFRSHSIYRQWHTNLSLDGGQSRSPRAVRKPQR